MQDIIPPQKPKKKFLKVTLIVSLFLLTVILTATVTYFLTKGKVQPKSQESSSSTKKETQGKEEGDFVYVTSKPGLNLRADAATTSQIVYTLPYRAKVKVLKKSADGKWYWGTYEGENGWFSTDYAAKEEPSDLTADWQDFESSDSSYSLKFPQDWQKKSQPDQGFDFEIVPKSEGGALISIQVKNQTIDKEKETLVDPNHNIASDSLIVVNSIKGRKIITQKLKNSKVVATTEVILLEEGGKLFRIEGPADQEEQGDIFSLLVWTINFKNKNV